MATNFTPDQQCEGKECQSITDVTYYVEEKKRLCDDCASKEGCIARVKRGVPNIYCEEHDEKVKLYCRNHGKALCAFCVVDHLDPCVRQNMDVAIVELQAKLTSMKEKGRDKLKEGRLYEDEIDQCTKDTDTHLQALKDEVNSTIKEAINIDKVKEKMEADKINQAFDGKNQVLQEEIMKINEKIRKNNEEREKQLELIHTNAQIRQRHMDNKKIGLHRDIDNIVKEKDRKIRELMKSLQDDTKTIENAIQTIDTVLEDDKNIVKDGHSVNMSVSDKLKKRLYKNDVKQITDRISDVRFVKGVGREKYDGRIGGYDGEWMLSDTISVKDKITLPCIVGCIDECNVIITDAESDSHTYMLDMNTKHIQRVITSADTSCVISCALLNGDKIVCGRSREGSTGKFSTGSISVYDKKWMHINDLAIPRNKPHDISSSSRRLTRLFSRLTSKKVKHTTDDISLVYVAVDRDGMIIIAAEWKQSKIYVINPADSKIVHTIKCKQDVLMRGVLSSGHIIAQPHPVDERVLIIDRQGGQREIPHSDVILNGCVDPITDDLYVVTSDDEYKTCVIDQVMSGSEVKMRRVTSFPLSTRLNEDGGSCAYLSLSCVTILSSGKIIASDGDSILVFEKRISL
ncbi:uncharacterized protein LOC121417897 [Lytechinus variegatus]|uniref:uncharacterized protein LOC121417897 n=1 Tax=Lytechinus variegatus TaxID=7654 RepID=UPI001BB1E294|nr:uncharacterized protein LOC121417897 [Lytechinus variegatus]